jgi:single-strand DNA-binding protein
MSNDLNLSQFIGRAGRDSETRYTPDGSAITNFTLAVGWKSKEREGVEWVRCVTFGKLAEIAGEYVKKGKQIYVSGRFTTREWDNKEGVKQYTTEIKVDQLQLLGSSGGESPPQKQTSRRPAELGPEDATRAPF